MKAGAASLYEGLWEVLHDLEVLRTQLEASLRLSDEQTQLARRALQGCGVLLCSLRDELDRLEGGEG